MDFSVSDVFSYFTFSTFIIFFFFGFLQLIPKTIHRVNVYLSMLFFAGGYQLFYQWAFALELFEVMPFLLNTELAVCLLIGPFTYLYFSIISGSRWKTSIALYIHYLPFAVSIILIIAVNLALPLTPQYHLNSSLILPDYSFYLYTRVLNTCCDLSMATYFVLALIKSSILFKAKKITFEFKIVIIFLLLIFVNAVILCFSNIFRITILTVVSTIGFSLLPVYYIFFSYRYPEFCLKVIKETKKIRYQRSMIKKLDIREVELRLIELMEEEKYFYSDLTLDSLSSTLMINSHQLSQLLNEKMGMNFKTFINSYRIDEIKRLLIEEPKKNILEIAFSVGFNSKSSFNSVFVENTGISPSKFRKNALNQL